MSKNNSLKREARKYRDMEQSQKPSNVVAYEQAKFKITPINESQRHFHSVLMHDEMVVGAGSAGTGKTFLASVAAAKLYAESKNFKYIILTRPNVEVGQKMGHLPGQIEDKYAPYMEPFEKGLKQVLGAKRIEHNMYKTILPQPLGYMRGKTFDDALILLDEAQNTTIDEMKMFITRVGTGSRMFITGDHTDGQNDLKGNQENGLKWLVRQIKSQQLPIEVVEFRPEDCVRSDLCKLMLNMIERAN